MNWNVKIRLSMALTALRALEVAYARCKSSNQFGFCSLTRNFHLSAFRFPL
jgi:hypothetical protein